MLGGNRLIESLLGDDNQSVLDSGLLVFNSDRSTLSNLISLLGDLSLDGDGVFSIEHAVLKSSLIDSSILDGGSVLELAHFLDSGVDRSITQNLHGDLLSHSDVFFFGGENQFH